MSKFAIRLLTLAMLSVAVVAAPVHAWAAPDNDPPPPSDSKKKKKSSESTVRSYAAFADAYRAAYATVYDRHDYVSAIQQLEALGRDDSAAVANLLGYSYRNAGNYDRAGQAYAKALKLNPKHTGALEYQGVLFIKLGQKDKAQANLDKIKAICGNTTCEEYTDLAKALG